jgi:transcription initiation factor TFIIB
MITIGNCYFCGEACRVRAHDVRTLKLLQQRRCPECGGTVFVTDRNAGEVTCRACGLVLVEDILDRTPEWRAFTPDEQRLRLRTGSPASLQHFDKGLSTTFLPHQGPFGTRLSAQVRQKMQRLQRWQNRARTQSSYDRNLVQAMAEISRLADHLTIPSDVKENAALIYRKALNRNLVRGRSIQAIAAASLYLACRLTQLPRKLSVFADNSDRTLKEISRYYRLIHRTLRITLPLDDPEKYLPNIASHLGLHQHVQNTAIQLIHKAQQRHAVVGKSPVGIAAAALYIAARLAETPVTQKTVAEAANVTEVTIRNRYQSLAYALNLKL